VDITPGKIDFSHFGIGTVLKRNWLAVPMNQREYSWRTENVLDLLQDFSNSIGANKSTYFLGTIVLTVGKLAVAAEVADGQQRLATTTILLAAIRDYLATRSDADRVTQSVEGFLFDIDRNKNSLVPRLSLNVDDNEFFRKRTLSGPKEPDRQVQKTKSSHERIEDAAKEAASHVQRIIGEHSDKNRVAALNRWIDFLEHSAQVIVLKVPDDINAFVMFETLNDRGLKTTQADMLKNYLFGESAHRISEAQHRWSMMKGALESVESDEIVLTFLRHFLVVRYGAIRDREVYEKIKSTVGGPDSAITFLDRLTTQAEVYAALLNHQHPHWQSYGNFTSKIRRHIETLIELRVEQIRPLMLACIEKFKPKEVEKAFRLFIAWAVRFMVGGNPTGTVEKYYAGRAVEVSKEKIKNAKELAEAMNRFLPGDEAFRAAFAELRVSKSHLARYYLRSLENAHKGDQNPEWVVNDDPNVMTLEHILPENPSADWGHIDKATAEAIYRRLGNLVLLRLVANSTVGNASFDEKKKTYQMASTLALTKAILNYERWGPDEIVERQSELAELAVKAWPLSIK
jgi:hypothetical protein